MGSKSMEMPMKRLIPLLLLIAPLAFSQELLVINELPDSCGMLGWTNPVERVDGTGITDAEIQGYVLDHRNLDSDGDWASTHIIGVTTRYDSSVIERDDEDGKEFRLLVVDTEGYPGDWTPVLKCRYPSSPGAPTSFIQQVSFIIRGVLSIGSNP